jgi:hypothetical protein
VSESWKCPGCFRLQRNFDVAAGGRLLEGLAGGP